MKNYFKKFSIMFVLLLVLIGIGAIQNRTVANAATIGQQLTTPEDGWKRYDDTDSRLQYTMPIRQTYRGSYMNTQSYTQNGDLIFKFKGNKLMIGTLKHYANDGYKINIDGVQYPDVSTRDSSAQYEIITFIKTDLTNDIHTVTMSNTSEAEAFGMDFIDIDKDGFLIDPSAKLLTAITLNKTTDSLTVGQTEQLTATTTPAAVGVTWKSSDESVATVDSSGKVTAIGVGTATITATTSDGLTAICTVNITKKVEQESISLNKSTTNLIAGDSETLVAMTTPSAINVTWNSSDTSVATVDSTGKVTAIGAGTTIITGTTNDGNNLSSSCTVTVANKTNPNPTPNQGTDNIINIAHAKGDNTNNAGGDVSIIFKGVAEAQLSVIKTADVQSVFIGDTFTYTIVVTNTSSKTAKAVVINDIAPNHIDFKVSSVTTTQGKVDASSTSKNIIVNVGDIPPLGSVTIKIPATVIL